MDNRKNNKGTIGNKGGRKPKSEEHKLIEKLTPLEDIAYNALSDAIKDNQRWAVKLFFEYMYGKPHESIALTTEVKEVNIISLGSGIKPIECLN